MAKRTISRFASDSSAAVAATYALALVGLVGAAGVGFDYARLATMDSELQSAADQAALAAATQLNGASDSMTRAVAQASNLVSNETLQANDTLGRPVLVNTVRFYDSKADAEADTDSFTVADTARASSARFVRVDMVARKVFYAMTPVVRAFNSGNIVAAATAGLGSSMCKVPPVMFCNPNVNPAEFDVDDYVGKGLLLKTGDAWAAGNFGFLDVGAGANDLGKLLAYGSPPGDCVAVENPTTQPGSIASVINDYNTRFDIYESGDNINCYANGLCPPSDNSRKDIIRPTAAGTALKDCGFVDDLSKDSWSLSANPYRPNDARTYDDLITAGLKTGYPDVMGYPRDICHAFSETGNCAGGRFGSGTWDINAYWHANYGAAYASQVNGKAAPTRYEVYEWERTNAPASTTLDQTYKQGSADKTVNFTNWRAPRCRAGTAPSSSLVDRRVLPVAVVNCTGLNGAATVQPIDWVEVFLVEPSIDRKVGSNTWYTRKGDIYVEVIRQANQGVGGTAPQVVRRDKPYLVN
ncbi:Flp pilus assembly protein TadG [Novosphingobium kunmingense]|uniref:Flp pilus assembly protein TadG n=1 Tax=Novosphingobium kunmingense TaxID=1211806 RepID=A0A2N0H6H1_9SPHN|nr:pilus assembly protein TadG-related protein [Novosphingobium kunmingense]PKB14517.1 Flp pilus assembly protein TadG [Novosphingobium kunmingense]